MGRLSSIVILGKIIFCFIVLRGHIMSFATLAHAQQMCSIQFYAFDTFGGSIDSIDFDAREMLDRRMEKRTGVHPTDQIALACGDYRITARAKGMTPQVFYISVSESREWQPLALLPGSLIGRDPLGSLRGTVVLGQTSREYIWIKLVELYSNIVVHTKVMASGSFELKNLRPSKYLLILFQGDRIVDTRSVEIRGDEKIHIAL